MSQKPACSQRPVSPLLSVVPPFLMVIMALATWSSVAMTQGDLQLYFQWAGKMTSGVVPYRDFRFEYPPGSLVPCLLPLLLGGLHSGSEAYRLLFLATNAGYLAIIGLAVGDVASQLGFSVRRSLVFLSLFAAITAPLVPWHHDLFPAMLTILALASVVRERPMTGGIFLGLGIAAKLYPVVLLPVFLLFYVSGRNWREAFRLGAGCAGSLLLVTLPFFLLGRDGLFQFLAYHQQRGIQIESLGGGVFLMVKILIHDPEAMVFNFGAWHVRSPLADTLAPYHTFLFIFVYGVVLGLFCLWFRMIAAGSKERAFRSLVFCCFAGLLVFLVTNKVFSPQYLAWLLPFATFCTPRQAVCFAGICAITMSIFPFHYSDLLGCHFWWIVLLNLRNALMVVLLVWIFLSIFQKSRKDTPSPAGS